MQRPHRAGGPGGRCENAPMLTHRQLRYFVEIVDAGGFSQAAERLFIAQSALSRQVREMEQTLQVTLLEREARPLLMTAAGRSLYADARRILSLLESAAAAAVHAQHGTAGTLQLLHSSSVPLTPPLLALLREHSARYPGLTVEISQASSEQQAMDIQAGRAELGLARAPILRRHGGVQQQALYHEALCVALPAEHPLAGRTTVSVSELRHDAFVATPHLERGGLSQCVAELCRAQGFQPRPAAVRSRKWSQLALVQGGFGIAIVPASMAALAPAGVCGVPLTDSAARSTVLALWREDAPEHVQRFVQALTTALQDPGATDPI